MSALIPSRAIVAIAQRDGFATELKRLALVFDEILYLPPHGCVLSRELQHARSRFKQVANGKTYIEGFSYARDITPGFSIPDEHLQGAGLSEVVTAFRRATVMRPCQFAPGVWEPLPKPLIDVLHELAVIEMDNDEFLAKTDTARDDFMKPINMGKMKLAALDGMVHNTVWVNPPAAFNVSSILTMLAYYGEKENASPVLLDGIYQRAMSTRVQLLQQRIRALEHPDIDVSLANRFLGKYGAAAFHLASALFDDDRLEELAPHEIICIRDALKEARKDFVSTHLVALTELVESNPWSEALAERTEEYVRRELVPALNRYNEEGRSLWEEAVGKATVRFAELSATAATGGSVGGLVGSLMQGTSFWRLLLLGAAAGALKTAPKIAGDFVELALRAKKRKRNGLAYLRAFAGPRGHQRCEVTHSMIRR